VEGKVIVGTEPGARAAGFYQKMGFSTVGQLFLNNTEISDQGLQIPVARFVVGKVNNTVSKAQ